jgi:DNA polymerase-3 subunit gamma/tau
VCQEITQSRAVDVLEIDGASNRGIDEIRELRERVKFAPVVGKYKIYIIDEVHMLTTEAFNALLKTLEEPPPDVVFILATTAPQKLPLTILSRCVRFDFRLIPEREIIRCLGKIIEVEKLKVSPTALTLIASRAEGSLRDAQSLLEQVLLYTQGKEVSPEDIFDILGLAPQSFFGEVIEAIVKEDIKKALTLVEEICNWGRDIPQTVAELRSYFHEMLKFKTIGQEYLELSPQDKRRTIEKYTQEFTEGELLRAIKILSDGEWDLKRFTQPKLILELAIVKLIKLRAAVPLDELVRRVSSLEGKIFPREEIKEEASPLSPEEIWAKVKEKVALKKPTLSAHLAHSQLREVKNNEFLIEFSSRFKFQKEALEKRGNKKLLEEILREEAGADSKLRLVLQEVEKEEEKGNLVKHPLVQEALTIFGGKVVKQIGA